MVGLTDLLLVQMLACGGTADWQAQYAQAKTDIALRHRIRRAVVTLDPDLGARAAMWEVLLHALDACYPAAMESSDAAARSI